MNIPDFLKERNDADDPSWFGSLRFLFLRPFQGLKLQPKIPGILVDDGEGG
jgi:hypothetical protein